MSVSSGDFFRIRPTKLKFPFELGKPGAAYLHLTNKTNENVAFKVKTTNWKLFFANPNRGIVSPGTTFRVIVVVDAQKEAPQDMLCKDRFLLQSFITPKGATENDITPEMFEIESGKVVKESVFGEIYVPVKPSMFISPLIVVSGYFVGGDLLSIQPTQLKFSFELEKWISSSSMQLCSTSLQLTNKTDEYVAFKFKVRATNVKNHLFNPNRGIVLPGTTCNVIVNMQASKEALHDMHCEDTFLIQSFIAPKGVKEKDITPEMFEKESGKVVKEFKFGVIYVPANPLVPEGSEKGSSHRASCVENGIQETYLLDAVSHVWILGPKLHTPKEN
ncbi:hypothetical protein MKW92_004969, partial [Papaver armeniacum]